MCMHVGTGGSYQVKRGQPRARMPGEPPTPPPTAATQERVAEAVFEALPDLPEQQLVDLLDFVFTQHSGSSFNPDNTEKKQEIVRFVEERPFAVSERGVAR